MNFESALAELEKLVERMERGNQTLEESLKDFERGVELTRTCERSLKEAEQRVEKLITEHGGVTTKPFDAQE